MISRLVVSGYLMALLLINFTIHRGVCAVSVHEGEEGVRRRLGESIAEEDRSEYENLLAKSATLRREIATISRRLPDASASEHIKKLNEELQQTLRDTITISQQSSSTATRSYAAERAIGRARKRDAARRLEIEKKRREEEDFNFIQNMRKMELVDSAAKDLQSRAVLHGLNDFGLKRVNELLEEYRIMEADYIFNGTNIQAAQYQKRLIEKFIGDSQAIEITNKQRQKELLDRTIQELAARGVSFMCRTEMKVLDDMLSEYRDLGFKLIDLSNSKNSASLGDEISSAQKATQAQKLSVEKYIGNTKGVSKCARRQFLSKSASA